MLDRRSLGHESRRFKGLAVAGRPERSGTVVGDGRHDPGAEAIAGIHLDGDTLVPGVTSAVKPSAPPIAADSVRLAVFSGIWRRRESACEGSGVLVPGQR